MRFGCHVRFIKNFITPFLLVYLRYLVDYSEYPSCCQMVAAQRVEALTASAWRQTLVLVATWELAQREASLHSRDLFQSRQRRMLNI